MSANIFVSFVVLAVAASKVRCCDYSYPVALDNLGPRPCPLPVCSTVQTTPLIEKPIIRLPAIIPCPQTISNKCNCMKTILKPQVIQQYINVPSVQRYIETSHRPVVEKIHYKAYPVNAGVRDACSNSYYYDDGEYSDCCCCYGCGCGCGCGCQDVCTLPVAAALPVTTSVPVATSVPVNTAVPVTAALPVRRTYPMSHCH